jgi:hypothetical protein
MTKDLDMYFAATEQLANGLSHGNAHAGSKKLLFALRAHEN